MEHTTIDCASIRTREDLHSVFREALQLPAWYGCNLDALHDCLTSLTGTVRLVNWEIAETALGKYGLAARRAITEAALENANLDLIL